MELRSSGPCRKLDTVLGQAVAFVGTTSGIGSESLWSRPLLATSGVDAGFAATLVIAVVSGVATFAAVVRLASISGGSD